MGFITVDGATTVAIATAVTTAGFVVFATRMNARAIVIVIFTIVTAAINTTAVAATAAATATPRAAHVDARKHKG